MLNEGMNVFDAASAEQEAEEKETETSESSAETSEKPAGQAGEETPKDLKPGEPLHKDERFRRVIQDRNRLRQEREEMLERIKRLEEGGRSTSERKTERSEPIPAWFATYFGTEGEAQDAWEHLKPVDRDSLKSEIRDEIRREQEASKQDNAKWDRWVDQQIESLEEEGETFEKNALMATMHKFRPTDDEGNLDFRKGLELLRLKGDKPSQVEARRKAASMTSTTKGTEPSKKTVVTAADIKKWRLNGEL